LGDDTPQGMSKGIRLVCTVSVKPNGTMRTHDHHAVNNNGNQQIPGEIPGYKQIKEWQHPCKHQKAYKGDPVLPGFKNIDAGKSFRPKLFFL
jgi:hypothetical protein